MGLMGAAAPHKTSAHRKLIAFLALVRYMERVGMRLVAMEVP